jgi:hypothetical protein
MPTTVFADYDAKPPTIDARPPAKDVDTLPQISRDSGHLCSASFRLDRLQPPRLDAYLLRKKGRSTLSTIEQTSQMGGKGEMAISLLNNAGRTAEQGTIISRP